MNKNNTAVYNTSDLFTPEQVKEINKKIKENILKTKTKGAMNAVKKGEFFDAQCGPLMNLLHPWLFECQIINKEFFGYDTYWDFHVENYSYNVYGKTGEYGWHIDANPEDLYDMKLTCLLNLSEETYEGGEFYTINENEKHEFTSGTGLVFNSLIGHKVTPVTKGKRTTLTYWAVGPSWK